MLHLKMVVLLLPLLVLLQCVTTAPDKRFSTRKQVDEASAERGWVKPPPPYSELRSQRGFSSQQHHLVKRRCNTATCMTQRLADFLVRSSSTFDAVYAPTNIGPNAYGKRDAVRRLHAPPL